MKGEFSLLLIRKQMSDRRLGTPAYKTELNEEVKLNFIRVIQGYLSIFDQK